MKKRDGQELARNNEQRVLKALHKYGWLRTRDVAALLWMRVRTRQQEGPSFEPIVVTGSALRMAQRTLARLRLGRKVIYMKAPDGSQIYGLSEAGARHLANQGIPAKPGKNQVRRVSLAHYHHRRIANEVAILAALQGFRVASEKEIAVGQWFGGVAALLGKRPDVVIRQGKDLWLVEVERSRRNARDYARLLDWITTLWPPNRTQVALPDDHRVRRLVFVCEHAFIDRLFADLRRLGWGDQEITNRIAPIRLLYVTEAKFLQREFLPSTGTTACAVG